MTIASDLHTLGALMKTNLENKGITGLTGNEGLTTLANRINDIYIPSFTTNLALTCTSNAYIGETITITATLSASYDTLTGKLSNKTIKFYNATNNSLIATKTTNSNGVATLNYQLTDNTVINPDNDFVVLAVFEKNGVYPEITRTTYCTVNRINLYLSPINVSKLSIKATDINNTPLSNLPIAVFIERAGESIATLQGTTDNNGECEIGYGSNVIHNYGSNLITAYANNNPYYISNVLQMEVTAVAISFFDKIINVNCINTSVSPPVINTDEFTIVGYKIQNNQPIPITVGGVSNMSATNIIMNTYNDNTTLPIWSIVSESQGMIEKLYCCNSQYSSTIFEVELSKPIMYLDEC